MNLRVACLVVFAVGCAPQSAEEDVTTAREDAVVSAQQVAVFRALLAAEFDLARARCLLAEVGVGQVTQDGSRFAGSSLQLSSQGPEWFTHGCGPSTSTPRDPNATASSLHDALTATRDEGFGLAQLAWGVFQKSHDGDSPALEFSSAEGREVDVELGFDDFERAQVTVTVTRQALGDAARELATVPPEQLSTLPPAQRHVAWMQLSRIARSSGALSALADANAALLGAGPGQYVRSPPRTCSALLLNYRCFDFTFVGAQQPQ